MQQQQQHTENERERENIGNILSTENEWWKCVCFFLYHFWHQQKGWNHVELEKKVKLKIKFVCACDRFSWWFFLLPVQRLLFVCWWHFKYLEASHRKFPLNKFSALTRNLVFISSIFGTFRSLLMIVEQVMLEVEINWNIITQVLVNMNQHHIWDQEITRMKFVIGL